MDEIAIDVRSLGKRYRVEPGEEFWALQDVSFRARRGEALAIIGSNGAGKSTLLKILSRVTEPTTGRAEIRGRVASLLEVGTGFHPELSGRENVYLNAAILGMRKAEIDRQLDAIVAFADIGPFLEAPIKHYSSGMRMRLAFAVAAHLDSEILIVDEVLAVGDQSFQRKCMGAMSDVARRGRTVLFVSHNMAAVQRLCSRALVLAQGRVVADEAPAAAVARYLAQGEDATPTDLAGLPRPGEDLGDLVRLVRCAVEDSTGRPAAVLRFGAPFSVRIDARARCALKDLALVIGIDSADDTRIATATSEDAARFFDASPHAPVSAVARFSDLVLRPGTYHVTVGVRHGQRGLDQVLRAARFSVSEACADGTPPSAASAGYLVARPDWSGAALAESDGAGA
jgi:homopolymeric O-antigen transport system ATP-binding protein